jgi:hypothetical protein
MANELVGAELRKGSGFCRKGEGFTLVFGETWNYRVKTDQVTSSRYDVMYNTPGLPRAGLIFGPLQLICDDVNCERDEKHTLYWNVTANFKTGSEQQKQNQEEDGVDGKRGRYNEFKEVTEEELEAYRMTRRLEEDPMLNYKDEEY